MRPKSETRWALFAVLAALLVASLFYQRGTMGSPPSLKDERVVPLPGATSQPALENLHRIELHAKGERTVLEKSPANIWRMTEPVSSSTEPGRIRELLSQIENARLLVQVDEAPTAESLAKFGLVPPRFELALFLNRATPVLRLWGGNENPFDGSVYVRREGEAAVYAAPGDFRWNVDQPGEWWRARALVVFSEEDVSSFAIGPSPEVVLERRPDGRWHRTRPSPCLADTSVVRPFLRRLAQERIRHFPEMAAEAQGALLRAPVKAELTMRFSARPPLRLRLFEQGRVLREDEGSTLVADVSTELEEALRARPEDFCDRHLLSFEPKEVSAITAQLADGAVVRVERGNGKDALEAWHMIQPLSRPAAGLRISAFLWELARLRIGNEPGPPLSETGPGRKAPLVWVELTLGDGRRLERLTLGDFVQGSDEFRQVWTSPRKRVVVDVSGFTAFPETVAEWLLPGVP